MQRITLALASVCALILSCAGEQKNLPPLGFNSPAPTVLPNGPTTHDSAGEAQGALPAARSMADLVSDSLPSLEPLYFPFNSDAIDATAREQLATLADYLNQHRELRVTISGHCDERGTAEYNLALGDRRARAARTYLTRMGTDPQRVDVVSFGAERPAILGDGETVWAKNRRAEFQVAGLASTAAPTSMNP